MSDIPAAAAHAAFEPTAAPGAQPPVVVVASRAPSGDGLVAGAWDSDRPDDKARGETMRMASQSFEFNIENGLALVGSPETVIRRLEAGQQKIGYDIFATNFSVGRMPEEMVRASAELFGKEVIPAFK